MYICYISSNMTGKATPWCLVQLPKSGSNAAEQSKKAMYKYKAMVLVGFSSLFLFLNVRTRNLNINH